MSTGIEVKDIDDLDIVDCGIKGKFLSILYSSDNYGNNYVDVPVNLIVKVLRDSGIIPVKVA